MNTEKLQNIVQTVGGASLIVFLLAVAVLLNLMFWPVTTAILLWCLRIAAVTFTIVVFCKIIEMLEEP